MLVLDSSGFSELSERSAKALALIQEFKEAGLWPPVVPTPVLVESLQGHPGRDANANRFLKTCITEDHVAVELARRAAELRRRARRGSAVDALVVAIAEPNGTVLTGDKVDVEALSIHATGVTFEVV